MLNVVMLSVFMLNVVMLSVFMLNVVILNAIMLSVVMLNVVVPIVVIKPSPIDFKFGELTQPNKKIPIDCPTQS